MFLKIQNLYWVEVVCQLFIIPGGILSEPMQPQIWIFRSTFVQIPLCISHTLELALLMAF